MEARSASGEGGREAAVGIGNYRGELEALFFRQTVRPPGAKRLVDGLRTHG